MEGVFSGPPYEMGLDLLITNRAEPCHDQESKNFKGSKGSGVFSESIDFKSDYLNGYLEKRNH